MNHYYDQNTIRNIFIPLCLSARRCRAVWNRMVHGALGPWLYFYCTFVALLIGVFWLLFVRVEVRSPATTEALGWNSNPISIE